MIDFCQASSAASTGCGVEVKGGGASAPSPDLIQLTPAQRKELYLPPVATNDRPLSHKVRDDVILIVAHVYGIDAGEIYTEQRYQPLAEARQAVYWALRKHTTGLDGRRPSWQMIAQVMKKKAHGTIMHGFRFIEQTKVIDRRLRDRLDQIESFVERL